MSKTLVQLNVGDKIIVPIKPEYHARFGANMHFIVADKNHAGYPSNSVTLITEYAVQMMAFDAKEPTNPAAGPMEYGNQQWRYSNIRQWLNSSSTAPWYSPAHQYDAPPDASMSNWSGGNNPYENWDGFLSIFDGGFSNRILTTSNPTKIPDAYGGQVEYTNDKMFFISYTESGKASSTYPVEGSALALFPSPTSAINIKKTYECTINGPVNEGLS